MNLFNLNLTDFFEIIRIEIHSETNQNFPNLFRNFYPNQTVSFRFNPKLVFNPNQFEVHSKSIRTCNPSNSGQSEVIRINPNLQSEWIRSKSIQMKQDFSESFRLISDRLDSSDWKFGLIRICSDTFGIQDSDWFWMDLGLIRIEKFLRIIWEWNCLVRIKIPAWFWNFPISSE